MKGEPPDRSGEMLWPEHAGNLPGDCVWGLDAPGAEEWERRELGSATGGQQCFRERGESKPVLQPEGRSGRRAGLGMDPRGQTGHLG